MNNIQKPNKDFTAISMYYLSRVIYAFIYPYLLIKRAIRDAKYKALEKQFQEESDHRLKEIAQKEQEVEEKTKLAKLEEQSKNIVIVRGPSTRFKTKCKDCNTVFEYNFEHTYVDLTVRHIKCPVCKKGYFHFGSNAIKSS